MLESTNLRSNIAIPSYSRYIESGGQEHIMNNIYIITYWIIIVCSSRV